MTRDELINRIEHITVSRRDRRSALYKPLLLLLLFAKARPDGRRRTGFSEIESLLKELIERYSPHDSAGSAGQPWWHLPTDRLWRVLDSEGVVIRESGTSRGDQHVPSLEALRQQYGEFPIEVQELLSVDPEASVEVTGRLIDLFFGELEPDKRASLLSDLAVVQTATSAVSRIAQKRRRPYVSPTLVPNIANRDPFEVDPDVVDRGNRAHITTLDQLAAFLKQNQIEPFCADPLEPSFDLGWEHDRVLYVAEIKSITAANEEKQLRLGLGQVLWYRHALQATEGRVVRAVLVSERQPSSEGWLDLCEALSVKLVWPTRFVGLR